MLPRPYQRTLRVWHGSATSRESVDLAARYGDPPFPANVTHPIGPYAEFGHTVLHLQAEACGLREAEHRASLELFQSEIAPVLRRDIPDPSFPDL